MIGQNNYHNNQNKGIARLVREYRKYGRLIVAYDFDNTIHDYHNAGLEMEDAIAVLKEAIAANMHLYCFTANADTELVKRVSKELLGIEDVAINESPIMFEGSSKPFYSILLDDRAGLDSSAFQLAVVTNMVTNFSEEELDKFVEDYS